MDLNYYFELLLQVFYEYYLAVIICSHIISML